MHKEGYVVTIRQNNQTIKEENGTCIIPFHTEYEIRLKNKRRKRALADVFINGELATKGGLILDANDHIDLERFIGDNLRKGDRFRLVPVGDHRVKDKEEPSNGEVEVVFYAEKEYEPPKETNYHHHHHYGYHNCHYRMCPWCRRIHCSCEPCYNTWGTSWNINNKNYCGMGSGGRTSAASANFQVGSSYASNMSILNTTPMIQSNVGEAGATVHGSESSQSFSVGHIDVDKSKEVRIRLRIMGMEGTAEPQWPKGKELALYCTRCGNKSGIFNKFCSRCGNKLEK